MAEKIMQTLLHVSVGIQKATSFRIAKEARSVLDGRYLEN